MITVVILNESLIYREPGHLGVKQRQLSFGYIPTIARNEQARRHDPTERVSLQAND